MMQSLFTGITGLSVQAEAMGVIGDNIANVKTVAFKSNTMNFAGILGRAVEGNTVGNGARIWGTSTLWNQGAPENTGNILDLAINGNGLFMMKETYDTGPTYYSRAGQFNLDKNLKLVNPDGLLVQGYKVTDKETLALGPLEDILVAQQSAPPEATTELSLSLNLDADATSPYSTSVTVYDSLGSPIQVTLDFTPSATGGSPWTWTASVDPSVTTAPVTSTGTLTFDADGVLQAAADPTIDIGGLINGADPLSINWKVLDAAGESDGNITGYAAPSVTTTIKQNGLPSGNLKSVSVTEDGFFTALYSNGAVIPLYQVALAEFPNYQGLTQAGNNLYAETIASGQPLPGVPDSGTLGAVTPGALEMSNVDLTREFVNLITTQRAYQANSKVISTSDEMLAELMNLKR